MSPTVLKALSIFGFWAMVMLICPLPLYSSYFNPKILLTNNNEQPGDEMSELERLRRRHIIARRTRIANLVCSLSNSLSGGLFVSLGIIHLLPEAAEAFNGLYDEETIDKYRPAFATAFCSYTLLLLLQRVVFGEHGHSHGGGDHEEVDEHDHHDHHHSHGDHPPHHGDHSLVVEQHHDGLPKTAQSSRLTTSNTTGAYGATTSTRATMDSEHTGSCQQRQRHDSDVRRDTAPFLSGRAASTRSSTRSSIVVGDIDGSFAAARSSIRASTNRADVMVRIVLDNAAPDEAAVQYHDNDSAATIGYHAAPNNDNTTTAAAAVPVTKVVTSLVLMLAFSLHGIAEGMALGVQDENNSVTLMILAIALHKWAEALSIGMSFQRSGLAPARCMVYIIAFSFSSPLGIGVGWVSEALLPEVLSAYLMAFSTGTFLYLGASDAVVEEFAHGSGGGVLRRWLKFGFYMCGAVLIFLISAFLDRDGDDGNSGSGGDDA